ncbi:MAG: hypothetical protein GC160_26435 [Acidobacteria bacterium]|nr:hypothetical protein [Acidobacteriota bacterium]
MLRLSVLLGLLACVGAAAELEVRSGPELAAAAARARPGDRILVAPGEYPGVVLAARGVRGKPVQIEALDSSRPPVFTGMIYAPNCAWATFRNLEVRAAGGEPFNGLNADDGGDGSPAVGLVFEGLRFVVERGNGLKLAGVDELVVRSCRFESWSGAALDLVGCHRGLIEDCRFVTDRPVEHGVQIKGGSADVVVARCEFSGPAARWVNIGGSTDRDLLRPRDAVAEAARILVEANTIRGGLTAVGFEAADASIVRNNRIEDPTKFVFRILDSTRFAQGFVGCRNGRIENNQVIYDSAELAALFNLGFGADWRSFTLRGNAWYDRAQRLPPRWPGWLRWALPSLADLPSPEIGGSYGVAPEPR